MVWKISTARFSKLLIPTLKLPQFPKRFSARKWTFAKIKAINGVKYLSEVYQDKALARSNDAQMIVVLKGVDTTFENNLEMQKLFLRVI